MLIFITLINSLYGSLCIIRKISLEKLTISDHELVVAVSLANETCVTELKKYQQETLIHDTFIM